MSAFYVDGVSDLFEVMLSDCQIAKGFQMRSGNMTYLINFAIAPCFIEILLDKLKN